MKHEDGQRRRVAAAPRGTHAFTLIEVLVVAGIIAILLGLLLPSLARARATTREVVCATMLRSWATAFHAYAGSYRGVLPHTDDRARNTPVDGYDPGHPEHESCYIDVLPPLMGRRAWRDYPNGRKPIGDVWQCAEATPLPDGDYDPQYKPSQVGYHSYAMNSYLEYDFPFGRRPDEEPMPPFLSLSRCRATGRTLLMFEQTLDPRRGYGRQGGHTMAGRFTAEDARALAERHAHAQGGLGGNVVMIDGHFEWRKDLWNESLVNPRVPERTDLTWFPY